VIGLGQTERAYTGYAADVYIVGLIVSYCILTVYFYTFVLRNFQGHATSLSWWLARAIVETRVACHFR